MVFCRLRYRLTLRDLSKILGLCGIEVSHEAGRDWEAKLLPVMRRTPPTPARQGARFRGGSWYVDETYLKVRGRWTYLSRAIDRNRNLVDAMLSNQRDMKAAKAFFRSARATMGFCPDRVTTGRPWFLSRAIRTVLGKTVQHRTNAYLNNRPEQDHRGIKVGSDACFEDHDAASRFCREHGELRDLLGPRHRHNQIVSASLRRSRFDKAARSALDIVAAA